MNIWRILDIDPTDDISTIKKAYAKKLKLHHPEEDSEGYQQLGEAYDLAIKMAKQRQGKPKAEVTSIADAEPPVQMEEDTPILTVQRRLPFQHMDAEPERNDPVAQIDTIMEQVKALYDDFPSRIYPENWTKLLRSDLVWNIHQSRIVSDRLFHFLHEHHHLPKSVWLLLEDCFQWRELIQKPLYMDKHSKNFCQYYLKQLDEPGLRFDTLLAAPHLDLDLFLSYRDAAYQALKENQLEQASSSLNAAIALFADEPELLRLQGEYCQRIGDTDGALDAYSRIISIQPDDIDSYLARAYIWYHKQHITETQKDCEYILSQLPNHPEALSLLGKCQLKLGNAAQAKVTFEQLLANSPHDYEALILLTQIRGSMMKQAKKLPAKERKLALQQLTAELGEREGLNKQIKPAIHFQVAIATVALALIMLFQSLLFNAFVDHTKLTPISYIQLHLNGLVNISSPEALGQIGPNQFVQTKITNLHDLKIYRYSKTNKDGNSSIAYDNYLTLNETGAIRSITPSGWVNIGYLGDTPILVITKESSIEIEKTGILEFEMGQVMDIPPKVLMDTEKMLQQLELNPMFDFTKLHQNQMIDVRYMTIPSPPLEIYFYGLLLLVLYRFFFGSLYKLYIITRVY
ncbi:tetratricopeptide repeat protein [Brevibacillus antibioticus]|uniref:Tetratricopeptide repeat protein n=1 Tax=Brevibacillus antibioticus TaxID=2570228 RepID=A0A4U2YCV5_9BACL|nr:tetratricopeptide repeat protein [Brevibacillus antibioticus]TKI58205.1 tetratricopeptide repeat protein [Brevibacillus antibioticus]